MMQARQEPATRADTPQPANVQRKFPAKADGFLTFDLAEQGLCCSDSRLFIFMVILN